MRRSLSVAIVVALAVPARADDLKVNWAVDTTITGVGALLYILTETAFKKQLGPDECRWCDEPLNGADRAARDALKWETPLTADYISNVTGFILAPASALGILGIIAEVDGKRANWPEDGLVVVESAVVASALTQLVKMTAARERPFVHFAVGTDPRRSTVEDNMSFFSGHSSLSFSLAVSSGTVASIRGYRAAPLIWATGLTTAVATGYLRIAADRHYFTDVITGAALGSAIGFSVPYFFHRRTDARIAVTPSSISIVGTW